MQLGLFEGPLAVGPGSIPVAGAGFLDPIPYGEMPCSALMLWEGFGPALTECVRFC